MRCQHENCGCASSDGGEYCGPYCANAGEGESLPGEADVSGSCACGHAACGLERERQPARGREVVTSTGRP